MNENDTLNGAMVVTDTHTGNILAMVREWIMLGKSLSVPHRLKGK